MQICVKCKQEMKCVKNGVVAIVGADWHKTRGYAGDKFKCPSCLSEVLITNIEPYIVSEFELAALKANDYVLEMPDA